jgi:two-component system nitrogen regulation response regulator GlnG
MRRASLLATDVIEPEHLSVLPIDPSQALPIRYDPAPHDSSLREIAEAATGDAEQQAIHRALLTTKGNKSEAARLLRVDYKTLHLKMKQYGIFAGQFRQS